MPEESVAFEKQIHARLRLIDARIAKLKLEKTMLTRVLEEHYKGRIKRSSRLRKNSLGKISSQRQIIQILQEAQTPVKAQRIYAVLMKDRGAFLNPSTFRTRLKRMVEEGVIERRGPRGSYQLVRESDT